MRHRSVEGGHLVRLEVGEVLPDALVQFCREQGIPAAVVTGLGALRDVELGYYDLESRDYQRTTLEGSWELLHLFADVATFDGELFAHTHVVLGGPDFVARGGHLFAGTISVTGELFVRPFAAPIERRRSEEFGLHFLDL